MTPEALDLSRLRPRLPSPLWQAEDERFTRRGVRLLLKRDDLIHPDLPGNKWRKLELNLWAAAGRTVLTFGGAYSNHLRATAAAGRLLGFPTIGVVRGDELAGRPLNPSLARCVADGMRLHFVDRATYRAKAEPEVLAEIVAQASAAAARGLFPTPPLPELGQAPAPRQHGRPTGVSSNSPIALRAWEGPPGRAGFAAQEWGLGQRPHAAEPQNVTAGRGEVGDIYVVPEGGSNALAVQGCVALGRELRGVADVVGVAAGTGGTVAGLAAGLGAGQRVIGFPVLKGGFLGDEIRALQHAAFGAPVGAWTLDDRFHCGGYARTTPELEAFAADFEDRHGLPVERLYVAKMLYGLTTLATDGAFPPGTTVAAVITGQPGSAR
ncbi:1-aminocyclopropane-1-carboxylate deaminase/D-cysteine desulfhydrase [Streptomyces sp. ISL-100]|uniref:1-aminocyclopropane-1-carboxylate deaminase/D-cysteine desulfhydrase n=1 Tax=Streptomyces sp. ISL-100 TaxID=2819173 RepID=UPI0020350583|nr:1-aminocyclopropane-1-carboxylate deaminase [Streptomyces sp. ISL-100]